MDVYCLKIFRALTVYGNQGSVQFTSVFGTVLFTWVDTKPYSEKNNYKVSINLL